MQYVKIKKEVINEKGYKLEFIAKELGISPMGLNYKIKGKSPFKLPEVDKLIVLLNLKKKISLIFFLKIKVSENNFKTNKKKGKNE